MAFELSAPPLTIFSPKSPSPLRSPSEIRFSRWNNANAQPFIRKQRSIKEVEDEIRREKRFGSASRIAENPPNSTTTTNENFKSIGTPSSPSRPSIPGRKSKYSKPPKPNPNPNSDPFHPAFSKPPKVKISKIPAQLTVAGVSVGEDGVSYRIPNAPFEFQYSYTETPKVKPLALREPPFAPFGPTTMPRPWTGRAPLTKKKLPEFDSFKLPPPHKKGVKTVQAPGPYLAGMGPKYVRSREEIMGEPLTEEEVKDLVDGCVRSQRQLNMGRDGFTHNMLDNIHAHWKRRRVCKIKCKGVCTVDMDNVRQQLEEKTGGKIIYSKGGVLFLYRGRNYNFKTRPRFPLMLWKPITPVYPRLIKQLPEGLTIEEAKEMRKRGRILPPIMKLGKNGVYCHLVEHVKEAFEECELVRINCQGMNPSDYRKIGGKLQDLVPCVLLSFENEHILMWRGRDWKSSLPKLEGDLVRVSTTDDILVNPINKADPTVEDDVLVSPINNANPAVECEEKPDMSNQKSSNEDASLEMSKASFRCFTGEDDVVAEETRIFRSASEAQSSADTPASGVKLSANTPASGDLYSTVESNDELDTMSMVPTVTGSVTTPERLQRPLDESESTSAASEHHLGVISTSNGTMNCDRTQVLLEGPQCLTELAPSTSVCLEGVLLLRKQAIEGGSAVILDDASLDAKIVYDRALALAKTAPPGPIFKHGPRRVLVQNVVKQGNVDSEVSEVLTLSGKKTGKRISRNQTLRDFKEVIPDTFPQGSLGVDELAKLLA